jgi:hypothetical protein
MVKKMISGLMAVLIVLIAVATACFADHGMTAYAATSADAVKTIYIGDSRAVDMFEAVTGTEKEQKAEVHSYDQNGNYWIARNYMGYKWMTADAQVKELDSVYHRGDTVVIMMGVNDCRFHKRYKWYTRYLKKMAKKYSHVAYVSVNAIRQTPAASTKTQNGDVCLWNYHIYNSLPGKVKWFDTYAYTYAVNPSLMKFTDDGMHYQQNTSLMIYSLILWYKQCTGL